MMIALNILSKLNKDEIYYPLETMLGSLANYVSTENKNYQPMNANFGIIKPLDVRIKDKKLKYSKYAKRSIKIVESMREKLSYIK